MKRPHDDSDSDSDSCVDLTEEPADVKPKIPKPYVFDIDGPQQAPIRRGLLLRSARSGFYATRSVNKNNGRQASSLILVARQFASEGAPQDERKQSGPMLQTAASPSNLPHRSRRDTGRDLIARGTLLAESDAFVRGEARQFSLRGPAVSRRGEVARQLGLTLSIGPMEIEAADEDIAFVVSADGVVETRRGSRLRRLGQLRWNDNGAAARVQVWGEAHGGILAKHIMGSQEDPDLDGSVLVEASALDFDVFAGVDESQ